MISQQHLLYAIDLEDNVYVVIGWREAGSSVNLLPVLAPVTTPGPVGRCWNDRDAATLRYSAGPLSRPGRRPDVQVHTDPDQTAVMNTVPPNFPSAQRLRP